MKTIILISLLLALKCSAQTVPYHKRQLYFDQGDNFCASGFPYRKDLVLLSVDYEGVADGVYYADAGSTCSETARKSWNKITAAKEWDYMEDTAETRFKFNQSVSITYSRFPRRPISIIATSTIINPTLVNGELWDCQIQGDGSIQSYGLYGRRDSCIMFLYCIKINKQSEIKSE